jgi:transcriptional regulator with PAS, ATPase and Fis domain
MIFVNCAAISQPLFESEMFGYSKGAFTGSDPKGKMGLIEAANGSTLFLDEIESLPLEQQGKLLRVIETQSITKVGSTQPISVNFRLITATNKNLEELVRKGEFRKDLYYRLNVFLLNIPPLRERKDDIRPLTDYYFAKYCDKYSVVKGCSEEAYRQLEEYNWPGNIRELKNLIERTVLMTGFSTEKINKFALSFFDEGTAYNMSAQSTDERKTDMMRLNEQIEKLEKM